MTLWALITIVALAIAVRIVFGGIASIMSEVTWAREQAKARKAEQDREMWRRFRPP